MFYYRINAAINLNDTIKISLRGNKMLYLPQISGDYVYTRTKKLAKIHMGC